MKYITSATLFAAGIQAQALTSVLGTPGVAELTSILNKYPSIVSTLAAAKDITILAPADGAEGLAKLQRSTTERGKDRIDNYNLPSVESILTYRRSSSHFSRLGHYGNQKLTRPYRRSERRDSILGNSNYWIC
jgi:hypothetical protein